MLYKHDQVVGIIRDNDVTYPSLDYEQTSNENKFKYCIAFVFYLIGVFNDHNHFIVYDEFVKCCRD